MVAAFCSVILGGSSYSFKRQSCRPYSSNDGAIPTRTNIQCVLHSQWQHVAFRNVKIQQNSWSKPNRNFKCTTKDTRLWHMALNIRKVFWASWLSVLKLHAIWLTPKLSSSCTRIIWKTSCQFWVGNYNAKWTSAKISFTYHPNDLRRSIYHCPLSVAITHKQHNYSLFIKHHTQHATLFALHGIWAHQTVRQQCYSRTKMSLNYIMQNYLQTFCFGFEDEIKKFPTWTNRKNQNMTKAEM